MTLDEAIKRLETAYRDGTVHWTIEDETAVKLGIEALERVKHERRTRVAFWADKLPGETRE